MALSPSAAANRRFGFHFKPEITPPPIPTNPGTAPKPADLLHHTLLHDVFTVDWTMWLRSAGIEHAHPHRGPTFLSSDHAIQAAIRGEGVVLGRSALVADELAARKLVRPFKLSIPAGFAYYAVCPPRTLKRPSVKAFRDWLIAEARSGAT